MKQDLLKSDLSKGKQTIGPRDDGHLYMQIASDEPDMNGFNGGPEEQPWCLQVFVEGPCFQMFVGLVIAANSIVIGLETDIATDKSLWQMLEDVFLGVFVLELLIRLCVYGICKFFDTHNPEFCWNLFDFVIVVFGVIDRVLEELATSQGKGGGARFIVLLLRIFRLLRILRIFRIFRVLKQLYLVATSLLEAAAAVLWVGILSGLIVYVCAIIVTRLIGQPDPHGPDGSNTFTDDFRVNNFGSVPTSMVTLFKLMAFPDMERLKPVYEVVPGTQSFIVGFIIFGSFVCVSMLTGILCETMVEKSRRREDERRFDRERTRRMLAENARLILQDYDTSGKGFLDESQFENSKSEVLSLCEQEGLHLSRKDLDALFELVDFDSSGQIEIEELLYGMVQLASEVKPMAIMELRRSLVRGLNGMSDRVTTLDARMQQMDQRLVEVLALTRGLVSKVAVPPQPAQAQ